MSLIATGDKYLDIADKFLQRSQLVPVLQKYGRVEFKGAYAGRVMLDGDIDIEVINDQSFSQDLIFVILKDIHDTCHDEFRSMFIKADWDDPRLGEQFPYGKYLGLKTRINKERWKFDIWFISQTEANRDRGKLDISRITLTPEQRETILRFKQYRKDHNLEISGPEIYQAVLEKDLIDPRELF